MTGFLLRRSLPDSKTGAKTVHLGNAAVAVLKALRRIDDNPYVIVGKRKKQHLTDLQHPWWRIRSEALLDDVRIHDLRHTFASGGLQIGEGLSMIGKLLGHTQVQTTARYAHLASDPVKQAADKISKRLAAALFAVPQDASVTPADIDRRHPRPSSDQHQGKSSGIQSLN